MDTRRILLTLALLMIVPALRAESVEGKMTVSAMVVASARLTVESQPSSIEITAADIARGYVELDAPIVLRVQTNSRRGYLLQVSNMDESFSEIEISFGNTAMRVASHESWVERPYVKGGESIAMHARLRLSPMAQVGRRSLPIDLTASAL
ncbi:MAG: hypothetical protein ACXW19_11460 [Thermoanaerobaculia bacterium]